MTYFEQAVRFFEEGKTEDAVKHFGYARDYGSGEEKARAEKILALLKSKKGDAAGAVHKLLLDFPTSVLLEEKRYASALEKLLALGDAASAEDFYFLGILHDDFGMGMPDDKEKALAYFRKSRERGFAAAAPACVRLERNADAALTPEQRERLEAAGGCGCAEAEMMLRLDDIAARERSGAPKEEIAEMKNRLADFLREKTPALGNKWCTSKYPLSELEVRLVRARLELELSSSSMNRYRGFIELLWLCDSWHTGIAVRAAAELARCCCNGIFVRRDLKEAEHFFKESLTYGKKDVPEYAREYLAGTWKRLHASEEGFDEWFEEKCSEVLRQIQDVLFLADYSWICEMKITESPSALRDLEQPVPDYLGAEESLHDVQSRIGDLAELFRQFLKISDAEKAFRTRIKKSLSKLKDVLAEMESLLPLPGDDEPSLAGFLDAVSGRAEELEKARKSKARRIKKRFLEVSDSFLEELKRIADELLSEASPRSRENF